MYFTDLFCTNYYLSSFMSQEMLSQWVQYHSITVFTVPYSTQEMNGITEDSSLGATGGLGHYPVLEVKCSAVH